MAKDLRYPTGEQNFQSIREAGKVYIDKTELIYNLVNGSKHIFLSRPRRFGKSLLLSTIQTYFEGKKDLFEGLAVEKLEKEWTIHPVLHLELSGIESSDHDSLKNRLILQFRRWENEFGIENPLEALGSRFADIIKAAYLKTGQKAVILVDEYDNPLINTLHHEDIFEQNRELLKSIYSNLKSMDGYIRFAMLTGVSRFSKTSIFSGLNNLTDITFDVRYSTICGFTEDEIQKFLYHGVETLAQKHKCSPDEALGKLKAMYDGYHFSEDCPDIYNPFSLLLALDSSKISDYWMTSGTPSFLIEVLNKSRKPFWHIFNSKATESMLTESDTVSSSPVSLMYQTGYLTIKDHQVEDEEIKYILGIPNREVEKSLFNHLMISESGYDRFDGMEMLWDMRDALNGGLTEKFLKELRSFLAGIPGNMNRKKLSELNFENTLYVLLKAIGFDVNAEAWTSSGRIDLLTKTRDYIYIMELKLDGSAEEALQQIEKKEYALPYDFYGRKIIKVGINFSSDTRNITDWRIA